MVRSDSHLHTKRAVLKRVIKFPAYRWFISRLDGCLPAGKWSRDYFLHYGAHPDRVFIVPHVVDSEFFRREAARLTPARESLRSSWNILPDEIVFLFVGKFIENKRPLHFCRAVHEANATGLKLRGLMVGDGPMRRQCEEFVNENKVRVSF